MKKLEQLKKHLESVDYSTSIRGNVMRFHVHLRNNKWMDFYVLNFDLDNSFEIYFTSA